MTATKQAESSYAEHLSASRDVSRASLERQRPAFRARFRRFLPADPSAAILDLGCGYGAFLHFLQREGYNAALGVDVDAGLAGMARAFGLTNVHEAEAGEFLEAHPAAFDRIFALDLVEHLPKQRIVSVLEQARRSLKPGGAFVMQSPNADGPFGSRYRYEDFTHTLAFTGVSARQVLKAAGFHRVEVHPIEPEAYGVKSLARRAAWKLMKQGLRLYLLAETGTASGYLLTQNLLAAGWSQEEHRS